MGCHIAPALTVLLAIAGCGSASDDGQPDDLCVNRALTAVLTVDVDDPRSIWATNSATGHVISLRLPDGYGVTADDELVDADGRVIAQTGDVIVGGCADLLQDALLITEDDIRREP